MADENLSAIDDESKAMLEDHVKKGKARKFILITKGATIKSLIVFKKGPYGPKINKAKKDGFRGEATCGVITGKGVNITFQLPGTVEVSSAMKAEGNVYEGEPCKIAKLRAFFADEADLKFKPEFEIVTSIEDVVSVSELDDADEDTLADSAAADAGSAEQKQKLVEALKKMTAMIQQAVSAQPARKDEILAPPAEIKEHLQADRLSEAKDGLLQYNGFLKEILAGAEPSAAAAPPPPPESVEVPSAKESEWNWRLKELTPKLKEVLENKLGDFAQVGAAFKDAQAARPADPDQAVELLKKCGLLVDAALTQGEGDWTDATEEDYQRAWKDASAEFPAQRQLAASVLSTNQLNKFDVLVEKANGLASQQEFRAAVEIAMRVADIATAAAKRKREADRDAAVSDNVVQQRKFLVTRWQQIPVEFRAELDLLKKRFEKDAPQKDAAALCTKIDSYLRQLFDNAQTEIDRAISAGDVRLLKGMSQRVLGNRVVDLLVNNPVVACSGLESKIVDTLRELETNLTR